MDLLIRLKSSNIHLGFILAASLAGVAGIALVTPSVFSSFVLMTIWLVALYWAVDGWRCTPTSLRLKMSDIEIELNGQSYLATTGRVMPFLIIFPANRDSPSVLVWKDSVADGEWRRLRMWLKVNSV